jgi:hypothetical protein
MTNNYNLAAIYTLLDQAFTDEALRRLCYDTSEFEPVYDQLTRDTDKATVIDRLVKYADQNLLLATLLHLAEAQSPVTYQEVQADFALITVDNSKQKSIDIPFVIVAMTSHEASELVTEKVFDNPGVAPAARTQFQEFRKALQKYGIKDLLPYYDKYRDDWRPPHHQQQTVKQTIQQIIDRVNQLGAMQIRPKFVSEDFFSPDPVIKSQTWQLTDGGSIIVADAVSMFHPSLHKALLDSEMSSKEQVAMLILSPINFSKISANRSIEQKIMVRALTRLKGYQDQWCEFGAGDWRVSQRWLFATLQAIANRVQNPPPDPNNIKNFRKKMGREVQGLRPFNW